IETVAVVNRSAGQSHAHAIRSRANDVISVEKGGNLLFREVFALRSHYGADARRHAQFKTVQLALRPLACRALAERQRITGLQRPPVPAAKPAAYKGRYAAEDRLDVKAAFNGKTE